MPEKIKYLGNPGTHPFFLDFDGTSANWRFDRRKPAEVGGVPVFGEAPTVGAAAGGVAAVLRPVSLATGVSLELKQWQSSKYCSIG